MDHKSLSQSVLSQIKEEHIKPKPQWYFALKNVLFWILFGLSVLMGARALGVMIFVVSDLRPELLGQGPGPLIPPLLLVLPLFWLILFISTILVAVLGLHHTKNGYKISIGKVIAINLLATLLLGLGFFLLGDGERFERTISNNLPLIPSPEMRRTRVWNTPVEGRLAGEITITTTEGVTAVTLTDLQGNSWRVYTSKAQWYAPQESGRRVRMIGTKTGEGTFTAEKILPWEQLPPPPRFVPNSPREGMRPPPNGEQPINYGNIPPPMPGPNGQNPPPPPGQGMPPR